MQFKKYQIQLTQKNISKIIQMIQIDVNVQNEVESAKIKTHKNLILFKKKFKIFQS